MTTSTLFDDAFLRRLEHLAIAAKAIAEGSEHGVRRAKRHGAGVDVADYRPYAGGDDLRDIDWNYYGGTRELLTRVFEEEEDLTFHLLLDASASMAVADGWRLRHGKQLAAALAYVALAQLDRVSVVTLQGGVAELGKPARGRSRIWQILARLEATRGGGRGDLAASLRRFVHSGARRGVVVVMSDFLEAGDVGGAIDVLRHHRHEPVVVRLFDERDLSPDMSGDIELVDAETGMPVLVTVTPALLAVYRTVVEERIAEVEAYCRRKDVRYFEAPVSMPFETVVLRMLREGGLLC
jgi:uncharacterized protein (DUF58 family)